MGYVKNIKRHTVFVSITVALLLIVTIGSTYAYYERMRVVSYAQSITAGEFSLSLNGSMPIEVLRAASDDEGLASEYAPEFYIYNMGDLDAIYSIILKYDTNSYNNSLEPLPLDYIKAALFDGEHNQISDVISLLNCPVFESSATGINNQIVLYTGSIAAYTKGYFALKLWIDEDLARGQEYVFNSKAFFKLGLSAVVKQAQGYSLTFTTYDNSTNSIAMDLSMLNSSFSGTSTTSSTLYTVTFDDLMPGTYTYRTQNDDVNKVGTLTIVSGDSLGLTSITNKMFTNAPNFYQAAKELYTTPWLLKQSVVLDSFHFAYGTNADVYVPASKTKSYVLTVPDNSKSVKLKVHSDLTLELNQ